MDARELAKRMERQRLFWIELAPATDTAPAKRVQMLRPLIDQALAFMSGIGVEQACTFLRGWDGITEADLVRGGDSNELVDFNPGNASTMIRDNADWSIKLARGMGEALEQRAKETEAVEKKPETS